MELHACSGCRGPDRFSPVTLGTLIMSHMYLLYMQYTDAAANPVALTLQEFLEPGGAGTGDGQCPSWMPWASR